MTELFSKEKLRKFVSGGIAGGIAKSTIAPLDRVKVLFQATIRKFNFHSAIGEFTRIRQEEGIRAFWKGNGAQVLRIVPYTAIVIFTQQFTMYDYYKNSLIHMHPKSRTQVLLYNFLPGSLAGATSVIFTYPFEVARTRLALQTHTKYYLGITHAFQTLFREEGIKGLFKGLVPTLQGIVIYSGVSFCIYFSSKEILGHNSIGQHFMFGAVAGIIGQFVSYPFDVVRKRMQAKGFVEKVSKFQCTHSKEVM